VNPYPTQDQNQGHDKNLHHEKNGGKTDGATNPGGGNDICIRHHASSTLLSAYTCFFACVSAVFRRARPKGERDQTSPAIVCKKSLLGNDKRVVQRSLVSRE